MPQDLAVVLHDLVGDRHPGTPAVILYKDYGQRSLLVAGCQMEAEIQDVRLHELKDPQTARLELYDMSPAQDAAFVQIDAWQIPPWAQFFEAIREILPQCVQFLLVFAAAEDLPTLERTAPFFWSWAKGQLVEDPIYGDQQLPPADLQTELVRLKKATGLSPQEYLLAWQQGRLDDSMRNSAWLNLAVAVTRGA